MDTNFLFIYIYKLLPHFENKLQHGMIFKYMPNSLTHEKVKLLLQENKHLIITQKNFKWQNLFILTFLTIIKSNTSMTIVNGFLLI